MFSTYGVSTDTPRVTCSYEDWLEILVEWSEYWTCGDACSEHPVRTPSRAVWDRALMVRLQSPELTDRPGAQPPEGRWENVGDAPEPWQ